MTLVDNFNRENLTIKAAQRLTAEDVVQVLGQVTQQRGSHPERFESIMTLKYQRSV